MTRSLTCLILFGVLAFGQIAKDIPDTTVVATLNGRKFTAGEVRKLVNGAPPQVRMVFERNPKQFLREHAYLMQLLDYAEKNKLDQQSPYKESLEFYRLSVLANAAINHKMAGIDVLPEEQKAFYEKNKERYKEVKVRMIYVPFADASEEEAARTKAASIAKRARAGEDFTKLATENAADGAGAAPEFTVRPDSSQPPEHMRKVLLNLPVKSISEPLRHDNGYYVFRVESADVIPYEQVRDDIYKEIQNARFQESQEKIRSQVTVQFDNEAFFQSVGPKQ